MRAVIIGGGISGLTAAYRLSIESQRTEQPIDITLLESSERLGGTIFTQQYEGAVLECGPDSFITTKPEGLKLAKELGLTENLIETNKQFRRAFIAFRKQLHPVPEGFIMIAPSQIVPLLASRLFSAAGKARMMMDVLLPGKKVDDESLASFVRRRLGNEVLERVAQPMMAGVYTADPEQLSLRSTMPQFLDYERKHGSVIVGLQEEAKAKASKTKDGGARYSMFVSFDKGMKVLVDALLQKCSSCSIRTSTKVQGIHRADSGWQIRTVSGEVIPADVVVLAVPAFTAAQLINADSKPHATNGRSDSGTDDAITMQAEQSHSANEKSIESTMESITAGLSKIDYASSVVLNLVYKRSNIPNALDGFGFVVPAVERRNIIACSYSSVKFQDRAPAGHATLRVFMGGALRPELAALDDLELLSLALRDLHHYLGIQADPVWHHIQRWPNSMPQYKVGHRDFVSAISEYMQQLPGILLAGNAYEGVGIPDCIRSGEQAAYSAMTYLLANEKRVVGTL